MIQLPDQTKPLVLRVVAALDRGVSCLLFSLQIVICEGSLAAADKKEAWLQLLSKQQEQRNLGCSGY